MRNGKLERMKRDLETLGIAKQINSSHKTVQDGKTHKPCRCEKAEYKVPLTCCYPIMSTETTGCCYTHYSDKVDEPMRQEDA